MLENKRDPTIWSTREKHSDEEVPTSGLQNQVGHVNHNEADNLGGFGLDTFFEVSSPSGHSTKEEKHFSGKVQGDGVDVVKFDGQEAETREQEATERENAIQLLHTPSHLLVSVDIRNNKKQETSSPRIVTPTAMDGFLIRNTSAANSGGESDTIHQYRKEKADTSGPLDDESSSGGSKGSIFRRFRSTTVKMKRDTSVLPDAARIATHRSERGTIDQYLQKKQSISVLLNDEKSAGSKSFRFRRFASFPRSLKNNVNPTVPAASGDYLKSIALTDQIGQEKKSDHCEKNHAFSNDEPSCGSRKSSRIKKPISSFSRSSQIAVKPPGHDVCDGGFMSSASNASLGKERDKIIDQYEKNSDFSKHLKDVSYRSSTTNGINNVSRSLKNNAKPRAQDANHANDEIAPKNESKSLGKDSRPQLYVEVAPGYNDDISTIAETISTIGERFYSYGRRTHMENQLAERRQSLAEWRRTLFDMTCQEDMKLKKLME